MNYKAKIIKRIFDFILAFILIIILFFVIILLMLLATIDTKEKGIFTQKRIGYLGKPFIIYKIRTIKKTTQSVSNFGAFLRENKLDELPQLFNILIGDMSFVGPRPDVPGFADVLNKEDQIILSVKPGLTGPASLKFKNEEALLRTLTNPQKYNEDVIWPQKIEINKNYINNYSFFKDIYYICKTLLN